MGWPVKEGKPDSGLNPLCLESHLGHLQGKRTSFMNTVSVGDVGFGAICRGLGASTGCQEAASPRDIG